MSDVNEALTGVELETLAAMEDHYRVLARAMTVRMVVGMLGIDFYLWIVMDPRGLEWVGFGLAAAGVAVALSGLVWYFGWAAVARVRAGREGGRKVRASGRIHTLQTFLGTNGDTITRCFVDTADDGQLNLITRKLLFRELGEGADVVVRYVPGANVLLSVEASPTPEPSS